MNDDTTYVIQDGHAVEVTKSYKIPQHDRPDGHWCRWSGCRTIRPDRLCPDRCQEDQA